MRATTADGHTLQLPDTRLRALLPQLHRSGCAHLVRANYAGDLTHAVARSVRQLAGRAQHVGALRNPHTGARLPVFDSMLGGRSVRLVTRPLGPGRSALLAIQPQPAAASGETETGPGAARVQLALFDHLRGLGLVDAQRRGQRRAPQARQVRFSLRQVNATGQRTPPAGRRSFNKPDISYVDQQGRRVNIEIDTNRREMLRHRVANIRSDRNAVHIGLLVDRDGNVLERSVINPGQSSQAGTIFERGGVPVQQIISQLPLPVSLPPARPYRPGPIRL